MGVAAAGNEGHGGVLDLDADQRGADVAFEMVDADEGDVPGKAERLGVGEADEEATDEAGAVGDGDGIEIFEAGVGLGEGFADDRDDGADVLAAGEFGDDATVLLVDIELRRYAGR